MCDFCCSEVIPKYIVIGLSQRICWSFRCNILAHIKPARLSFSQQYNIPYIAWVGKHNIKNPVICGDLAGCWVGKPVLY